MFCPNCREEYREGFYTCAECGAGLVRELPPEPPEPVWQPPREEPVALPDEIVVLDILEGLDWPMLYPGYPVAPVRLESEYVGGDLTAAAERLEREGIPALLLPEGSAFHGISAFGVTFEGNSVYVPESAWNRLPRSIF